MPSISIRLAAAVALLALPHAASAVTLWDNGPLPTGTVATDGTVAPDGTAWSESRGGTIGWTASPRSTGAKFRIVDNFTVPAGETWSIDDVHVFSYVSDSPTSPSRIVGGTVQIWSGDPSQPGSTLVYGDDSTNRFISSAFSNVYRAELNFIQIERPIMDTALSTAGLTLSAGTYWLDWDTRFNLSNRTFAIPVNVPGLNAKPGSDGLQSSYDPATGLVTYTPLMDSGVSLQQDVPFILNGSSVTAPEPTSVVLAATALTLVRRRR
jgi:hypothetical protein